jgi:hypothetical protein
VNPTGISNEKNPIISEIGLLRNSLERKYAGNIINVEIKMFKFLATR